MAREREGGDGGKREGRVRERRMAVGGRRMEVGEKGA